MQKIGLHLSDKLLYRAVFLILKQFEYQPAADLQGCHLVITDIENFVAENCRMLYIGREYKADTNYLHRPFEKRELLQAIKYLQGENESQKLHSGGLKIDKKHIKATYNGEKIPLTEKEFALLLLLYENRGKTVSDAEIMDKVWKNETVTDSNIAAVYVNYLRKKLDEKVGKKLILRIRGQGYMYKEEEWEHA